MLSHVKSRSMLTRFTLVALGAFATPLVVVEAQTVTLGGIELETNIGAGTGAIAQDGARLQMMDGEYEAARSAVSTGTFNMMGPWATSYRISVNCDDVPVNPDLGDSLCPGDGIAFFVTAGGTNQVGTDGFNLGYGNGGVGNFEESVAFGVSPFWEWAVLGENGEMDTGSSVYVGSGWISDDLIVDLEYDGVDALTAKLSYANLGLFTTIFYTWTAPAWAADARVGFSASSGLASENSFVSDWTLDIAPVNTVPEPSTWALMAFGLVGLGAAARRRRVRNAA